VCVCVLTSVTWHANYMFSVLYYCHLWPVWLYDIFPCYLINSTNLSRVICSCEPLLSLMNCSHTCVFQVCGLIISYVGIHSLVHNLFPNSTKFVFCLLHIQGAVPVSFNVLRWVNTWLYFRSLYFLEEGNMVYVYVYIIWLTVIAHNVICWWWKLRRRRKNQQMTQVRMFIHN